MDEHEYTRQEAIAMAGVTSSKASYFDRMGLVVPVKIGIGKKPYVFYSLEQIELLRQLDRLSKWFQLEALGAFVDNPHLQEAMLAFLESVEGEQL